MLTTEQREQLYKIAGTNTATAPVQSGSAVGNFTKKVATRSLGGALKVIDQIQRPYYALMNVGKDIVDRGEFTPFKSAWEGATLKKKTEFSDVTTEMGWKPQSTGGKIFKGIVDFAGSVVLDPSSYVNPFSFGKGVFKVGAKGAQKVLTQEGAEILMKKLAKESGEAVTRKTLNKVASRVDKEVYDRIVGEVLDMGMKNPEKIFAKRSIHLVDPFTSGKLFDKENFLGSEKWYKGVNKVTQSILDKPMIRRPLGTVAKTIGNAFTPNYSLIKSKNLTDTDKYKLLKQIGRVNNARSVAQTEDIANAVSRFGDFNKSQREQITFELEKFLTASQKGAEYSLDNISDKNVRNVVGELRGEMKNMWDSEVALGLRDPANKIEEGYVKRMIIGANPLTGSKVARTGTMPVEDSINAYKSGKQDWYFEPDVAKWWAARATESDYMKIKKENIDWLVNNKYAQDATKLSTDQLMKKGFKTFDFAGNKFASSPEIVKEFKLVNFEDKISQESTKAFMRLYDNAMNFWKLEHTSLFPSFHARNLVSNMYLMFLGGFDNPVYLKTAFDIQQYGSAIRKGKEVVDKTIKIGSNNWKISEIYDMAYKNGVIGMGQFGTDFLDKVRIRPKAADFVKGDKMTEKAKNLLGSSFATAEMVGNWGRKVGSAVENNSRLALFVDQLAKGTPAEEAATYVKKFLFDYGDLTDIERGTLKRVMPFYTWMRKNVPLQLEQLAKQPGKYSGTAHLQKSIEQFSSDRNEQYLPDYMKSGEMRVRLPNGKYYTPDLPLQDLGDVLGANRLLSQTNPLIQGIIEWTMNKDVFSGKPLADQNLPDSQFKREKIKNMILDTFRTRQLWKKASNYERTTAEYWLDVLLGINITAFDVAKNKKYQRYDRAMEKSAVKKKAKTEKEAQKETEQKLKVISPFE